MLPMRAFDRQSKNVKQPSQLADRHTQPFHKHRPKSSKPVSGKLSAASEVKQAAAPTATGAMPMRTRAEGGRKRRK